MIIRKKPNTTRSKRRTLHEKQESEPVEFFEQRVVVVDASGELVHRLREQVCYAVRFLQYEYRKMINSTRLILVRVLVQ